MSDAQPDPLHAVIALAGGKIRGVNSMRARCLAFSFFCLLAAIGSGSLRADCKQPVEPPRLKCAGIVLKWIRGDKAANFRRVEPMIRQAAAEGAQVVCTTECFL